MPGAGNPAHSSLTSPAMRALRVASAWFVTTSSIHAAIRLISASFIPRLVTAGVPSRTPDGSNGFRGSNGTEL